MNKKQLIKLIIFFAIIFSQIFPMKPVVTKAQAMNCCKTSCGKNVRSCPMQKKSRACHNDPVQCCKDNCFKSSKSEILINKGPSFQKFSLLLLKQVPFTYFQTSWDNRPSLFYEYINHQKKKLQNPLLFQINSVYLI